MIKITGMIVGRLQSDLPAYEILNYIRERIDAFIAGLC